MRQGTSRWLATLSLLGLLGCAESTMIRSSPTSAKMYYRGHFVGLTPKELEMPHSDLRRPVVVRLEHDGYELQDVPIPTEIGAGRIVGAVFTLGLSLLWKPPTTIPDEVEVALTPAPQPAAAAPPPATAPGAGSATGLETRLRQLKSLYDEGLITEQEYRRRRAAMLEEL
jgi:hypothetical protein